MKTAVIIAAAGIGRRMNAGMPKQYLELCSRPVICHTLDLFSKLGIDETIIAVDPGRMVSINQEIIDPFGYSKSWKIVAGGDVRQGSVANALAAVSGDVEVVLVHDGVRPFVTPTRIELLMQTAFEKGACILAERIKDTIKRVKDGVIIETVDRTELWAAGTPQAFRREILEDAMRSAFETGFVGTDEAGLVERIGKEVYIVEGDGRNVKITTPADLILAEAILKEMKTK